MPTQQAASSALTDHLAQRTATLVARALEQVCTEVEFYRSLPRETLDSDVTRIIGVNLTLLCRTLASGEIPAPKDFAALSDSAGERADEEVPLTDVLAAYHTGARVWWEHICGEVVQGALRDVDLGTTGRLFFAFLNAATNAVVAGYEADHTRTMHGAGHAELFTALVHDVDVAGVAEQLGLIVAQRYWLACIDVGPSVDEASVNVASAVASRRKVRRLQRQLSALGLGDTLHSIGESGGVALIPVRDAQPHDELAAQLGGLSSKLRADTLIALDCAPAQEISARLADLQHLLRVARRTGRRSGVVELADLAVEYQLSLPSRARGVLAAVLGPLADDPALSTTLRMYLRCNASSAQTAERLFVHPNTVLYRLRKITELTGLNLTQPSDLFTAYAAMLAVDATHSD